MENRVDCVSGPAVGRFSTPKVFTIKGKKADLTLLR